MNNQERLEEIKELLADRDKHVVNGEVDDYQKYDEPVYELNDNGHIDWLVQRVAILEQRNKRISETALKQIDVTQARNERLEDAVGRSKLHLLSVANNCS